MYLPHFLYNRQTPFLSTALLSHFISSTVPQTPSHCEIFQMSTQERTTHRHYIRPNYVTYFRCRLVPRCDRKLLINFFPPLPFPNWCNMQLLFHHSVTMVVSTAPVASTLGYLPAALTSSAQ